MKYQVGDIVKVMCEAPYGLERCGYHHRGTTAVVLCVDGSGSPGEDVRVRHSWPRTYAINEWWYSEDSLEPYIGVGGTPRFQPEARKCQAYTAQDGLPAHRLEPLVCTEVDREKGIVTFSTAPRMQWSTVPEGPVWEMADRLTRGLQGGDDPTKVRGIFGWREMYRKDPEGTVRKYSDSLMRHLKDKDYVGIMTNAAILRDLELLHE